jgi:hypothetical protein
VWSGVTSPSGEAKAGTTRAGQFRKKPVVVHARQWLGGDYPWLYVFCGQNWNRADVHDMHYDDPEQVIVFNTASQ